MNRLKFFGILTVKQRLSLIPVFILTVISSGLEVFGLGLLIPFFQYLSDPESIARLPEVLQTAIAYLPGNNHSEVAMSMALLLIAVFVLKGLISILTTDRKSTRLNSSHVAISYAVFCLKKKIRRERR